MELNQMVLEHTHQTIAIGIVYARARLSQCACLCAGFFFLIHSLFFIFNFIFSSRPSLVYFLRVCTYVFVCLCFRLFWRRRCYCLFNKTHLIFVVFFVDAYECLFILCVVVVVKNVVALLIDSIREFARGKYMHERVNVSKFKRYENADI